MELWLRIWGYKLPSIPQVVLGGVVVLKDNPSTCLMRSPFAQVELPDFHFMLRPCINLRNVIADITGRKIVTWVTMAEKLPGSTGIVMSSVLPGLQFILVLLDHSLPVSYPRDLVTALIRHSQEILGLVVLITFIVHIFVLIFSSLITYCGDKLATKS